jgi:hypothetical protein
MSTLLGHVGDNPPGDPLCALRDTVLASSGWSGRTFDSCFNLVYRWHLVHSDDENHVWKTRTGLAFLNASHRNESLGLDIILWQTYRWDQLFRTILTKIGRDNEKIVLTDLSEIDKALTRKSLKSDVLLAVERTLAWLRRFGCSARLSRTRQNIVVKGRQEISGEVFAVALSDTYYDRYPRGSVYARESVIQRYLIKRLLIRKDCWTHALRRAVNLNTQKIAIRNGAIRLTSRISYSDFDL